MGLRTFFFGETPCAVAALLKFDPDGWGYVRTLATQPFEIRHSSGLTVWVSNGSYGVHVTAPRSAKWGDVTFLSSFGLSPGHLLIWNAYRRWRRTHPWEDPNMPGSIEGRTMIRSWLIRALGGVPLSEHRKADAGWRKMVMSLAERLESAGLLTIIRDDYTELRDCDVDGQLMIVGAYVSIDRCRLSRMPLLILGASARISNCSFEEGITL